MKGKITSNLTIEQQDRIADKIINKYFAGMSVPDMKRFLEYRIIVRVDNLQKVKKMKSN